MKTSKLNNVNAKSVLHLILTRNVNKNSNCRYVFSLYISSHAMKNLNVKKVSRQTFFYRSCLMVLTIAINNNYVIGFNVHIISMLA